MTRSTLKAERFHSLETERLRFSLAQSFANKTDSPSSTKVIWFQTCSLVTCRVSTEKFPPAKIERLQTTHKKKKRYICNFLFFLHQVNEASSSIINQASESATAEKPYQRRTGCTGAESVSVCVTVRGVCVQYLPCTVQRAQSDPVAQPSASFFFFFFFSFLGLFLTRFCWTLGRV